MAKIPRLVRTAVAKGLTELDRLIAAGRAALTKTRHQFDARRDTLGIRNKWTATVRMVERELARASGALGNQRGQAVARFAKLVADFKVLNSELELLMIRYTQLGDLVAALCKWQREANRAPRVTKAMRARRKRLVARVSKFKVRFRWANECAIAPTSHAGLHYSPARRVRRGRMTKGVALSKVQGITTKEHNPFSHEVFLYHQLSPTPVPLSKPVKIASKVSAIDNVYWSRTGRQFVIVTTDKYAGGGHQEVCFGYIPRKGAPAARCMRVQDLPHKRRIGKRRLYKVKVLRVGMRGGFVRVSVNFEGGSGHPGHDVNLKSELGANFGRNSPRRIGAFHIHLGN